MADRIQLRRNPVTSQWESEAEAMGVTAPLLITADLVRLRRLLTSASPELTAWEWGLISHVLPDEGMELLADVRLGELIVSASSLSVAIQDWADDADDGGEDQQQAEGLARRALGWSEVERWALITRGRTRPR